MNKFTLSQIQAINSRNHHFLSKETLKYNCERLNHYAVWHVGTRVFIQQKYRGRVAEFRPMSGRIDWVDTEERFGTKRQFENFLVTSGL